jgi:hypothetical protein
LTIEIDNNTNNNNNNNNKNKHQGIVVVVALIAAASLLSLGAVAATTITPAFAGGDDDDGVKQKAKAKNNCRVNEAEDNERASVTQGQQGGGPTDCIAVSANVNDFELIVPGGGSVLMDSIGTNLEE